MTDVERLRRMLRESWDGDPWYGLPASRVLEGVSATRATERVLPGSHTIAELVLHVTAWMDEVRHRLEGRPPGMPPEGEWPSADDLDEAGWRRAQDRLGASHETLLRVLETIPDERLDERIGGDRDRALGAGVTVHAMLVGLAQHGAYHLGQIALLAKHGHA